MQYLFIQKSIILIVEVFYAICNDYVWVVKPGYDAKRNLHNQMRSILEKFRIIKTTRE